MLMSVGISSFLLALSAADSSYENSDPILNINFIIRRKKVL
jgi:hypothetical protein